MATITSSNPYAPDDVVAKCESVDPAAVSEQVRTAAEVQRRWRAASAFERSSALNAFADAVDERADKLAELVSREVGKVIGEAVGEVGRVSAIARFYAQSTYLPTGDTLPAPAPGLHFTSRVPRGVVAAITPWNFPLAIPMWKALPAIAFGNAVLLKPASQAIACAAAIADLLDDVLPDGLFQVVLGGSAVAERLIDNDSVAAITFTGSTVVGRGVAARAAALGKPAQCEMGGQNASVVLADADLELAAKTIAGAAMGYAGQKCTATSRVIVDQAVAERFVPLLVDAVGALPVGDPMSATTVVGPLIDQQALDGAREAVAASGGEVLLAESWSGDGGGWMLPPILVRTDDQADVLNQTEVFAPVASVQIVDNAEAALDAANSTRYGLVASVFTHDLRNITAALDRLEVGLLRVNAPTSGVDFYAPFGGSKDSSFGPREQGLAAADFFTETKTVLMTET